MTVEAVEVLRDCKIDAPVSANARVKVVRQVFKFGIKKKLAPSPVSIAPDHGCHGFGNLTFLVNDWDRPFTDAGFGHWFRDRLHAQR